MPAFCHHFISGSFYKLQGLLEFPVASKYDCLGRALIYKHICLSFHPSYGGVLASDGLSKITPISVFKYAERGSKLNEPIKPVHLMP